jgi:hypothetical protein
MRLDAASPAGILLGLRGTSARFVDTMPLPRIFEALEA